MLKNFFNQSHVPPTPAVARDRFEWRILETELPIKDPFKIFESQPYLASHVVLTGKIQRSNGRQVHPLRGLALALVAHVQ